MDDIDYGALFGLDEGGNEQGVAEPAEDQTEEAQGAEEQEVAEPAVEEETPTTGAEDSAADTDPGTGTEDTKPQQTKEERAQYAAARRKAEAERDAAIARAREEARAEAQREIDEAFANSGMTNPYTRQPIRSKAEFDEYRKRFGEERTALVQKKSGLSEQEFSEFVSGLPEVRAAKQAQEAAEKAARQMQQAQAQAKLDEQLREIHALDPGIKELKDLTGMANYQQFYELVKRGNTLVDAYKLANYDTLTRSTAAAARQAATNAARSKDHLSPTTQRGAGAVTVPSEIREAYRAFNPGATDAEIQQHYNSYLKK